MKILEEMPCYYFTCSAELLEQLDAFKNQDKKVINIEDKTFYFYLYEEECTGTMEFFDEPNVKYPVNSDWDGYQIITNNYWCFGKEENCFRQNGFLNYDEMINYIEIGFMKDYLESQFKW